MSLSTRFINQILPPIPEHAASQHTHSTETKTAPESSIEALSNIPNPLLTIILSYFLGADAFKDKNITPIVSMLVELCGRSLSVFFGNLEVKLRKLFQENPELETIFSTTQNREDFNFPDKFPPQDLHFSTPIPYETIHLSLVEAFKKMREDKNPYSLEDQIKDLLAWHNDPVDGSSNTIGKQIKPLLEYNPKYSNNILRYFKKTYIPKIIRHLINTFIHEHAFIQDAPTPSSTSTTDALPIAERKLEEERKRLKVSKRTTLAIFLVFLLGSVSFILAGSQQEDKNNNDYTLTGTILGIMTVLGGYFRYVYYNFNADPRVMELEDLVQHTQPRDTARTPLLALENKSEETPGSPASDVLINIGDTGSSRDHIPRRGSYGALWGEHKETATPGQTPPPAPESKRPWA